MNKKIVERETQLAQTIGLQQKIDSMNEFAWKLRQSDLARASMLSQEAYQLACQNHYIKGKAYSLYHLASYHTFNNNYEEALWHGLESIALFESINELEGLAQCTNRVSQIKCELGDYPSAVDLSLKYLKLSQQIGNVEFEGMAHNNLAMIYDQTKDWENALFHFEKSIEIHSLNSHQRSKCITLNNASLTYLNIGKHEKAFLYAKECLKIVDQNNFIRYRPIAYDTLGQIHSALGDYKNALFYLEKSLEISQVEEYTREEFYTRLNIGKIYQQQGAFTLALDFLTEALRLAEQSETKLAIFECHKLLAQIYEQQGDFRRALEHHKQFHAVKTRVFNEESDKQVKMLQVRHRTETTRKEAEIYRLKNEELEREIAERQRIEVELMKAKEASEVANKAKSRFLANMSHEFRTPLNAIMGFSQLMARRKTLSHENKESLGIIQRSSEHLLTLINNVLDLSKIEAGQTTLHVSSFDLYQLLDDLEDMFHLKAEDKHLQLLFERQEGLPQYVRTDSVKLRQIIINLLNNALKFTIEGGVSLRVRQIASQGTLNKLHFEITDSGQGIGQEELDQLFEPFTQTETGKKSQEGTGLGLPISRQFVGLMGGRMKVDSQVGVGTVFTFDIQVEVISEKEIEKKKPSHRVTALQPNQPRYRILIADDKYNNRLLLMRLLSPLGFDLREAQNGKEAIQAWYEWQPHLIWMDMRMPVMDGYEATKHIKTNTNKHNGSLITQTKIIALTASTYEEEKALVLSAGCDDFLRKPFRAADIFTYMHNHIGVRYHYEDNNLVTSQKKRDILTPIELATLPHNILTRLTQVTTEANMLEVEQIIEEIRRYNADIADKLAVLANDFHYGRIHDLIKEGTK